MVMTTPAMHSVIGALLVRVANALLHIPYFTGFVVGWIGKTARLTWAALKEGYETGKQLDGID